jgi:type IX secretion system PorP/SprF family membrane protein
MYRLTASIIVLIGCVSSVFAQLDLQLSQYMFNNTSFNPAAVGESGMVQVIGQHRIQWVGIPNAGKSTLFGINSPMNIGDSKHGFGLKLINDVSGYFTNQTAQIQYAYKKTIGNGQLSFGTDIGMVSIGFMGDSIGFNNKAKNTIGDYHDLVGDPVIPQTEVSGMSLDVSIGAFFSLPRFYTGVSYQHLNNPSVIWGERHEYQMFGTLFFTSGYQVKLLNPKYVMHPSILFKTDFNVMQIDLATRIEYDSKYWGGLSYRLDDAVVIMAGLSVSGGFSLGYAYDLPVSNIIKASSGSHEIVLLYSFEYISGKRNSKYKSIRIL